jgi:DNA-binding response OmpR family regulator
LVEQAFRVECAMDYRGAVKLLEVHHPDLVCLDIALPRESGLELCEHIRKNEQFAVVPILVLSDRCLPEDMANAEEAGANAFLKKPFKREKLLKYVSRLLDGPYVSRPSVRRLRRSDAP